MSNNNFFEKLQKEAEHLLQENYIPPQRYGTAFHLSPPVTDLRKLSFDEKKKNDREPWIDLPADIQKIISSPPAHDPYMLWQLSQGESYPQQVLHIQAQEHKTIQLNGAGIIWIIVGQGSEVHIEDEIINTDFAIRRLFIWQQADSRVVFTGVRAANAFLTEQCQVFLQGEKAQISMRHFIYGKEREQVDVGVSVYHQAPATQSSMVFRAAAETHHVAMYRGLIDIAENARGSQGYQQGRGLLLGKRAVIDMLPELKIKTNDVQCSHGVTTTYPDSAMLFYARSRGLSETQARQLAIHGFYHHQLDIPFSLAHSLEEFYG